MLWIPINESDLHSLPFHEPYILLLYLCGATYKIGIGEWNGSQYDTRIINGVGHPVLKGYIPIVIPD